jgi:hypothetical protein
MVIPSSFKVKWADLRLEARGKKETWLMWMMWHQMMAVNVWHVRINQEVATTHRSCNQNTPETMIHRFWDCLKAKATWEWAFTTIHSLLYQAQRRGRKKAFDVSQCLFTKKLHKAYMQFSCIWMLGKGLVLWATWLGRNDKIFDNVKWCTTWCTKLGCTIWEGW